MDDGPPSDENAPAGAGAIADPAAVRAILIAAARAGESVSYAELLGALGHRFTRPKMRALCRTLDAVDRAGLARGEPELAVLVVRESDRLPGQGWWASGQALARGHDGAWRGPAARALVDRLQREAFAWWKTR